MYTARIKTNTELYLTEHAEVAFKAATGIYRLAVNLPVSCFCYMLSFKLIIHMLLIWLLLLRSPSSRRRSQALLVKPPAVDFIVRNFRVGLQHIRAEIVLLAIYLDLYQRRWVITRQ